MKISEILKTVGSIGIQAMLPGVGPSLVREINSFLPKDKKLPFAASGVDAENAISSLPPEQQAQIKNKEYEVEIVNITAQADTLQIMLDNDRRNPQSTRPYIAKRAFQLLACLSSIIVLSWSYGILVKDKELITAVVNGWPFVASVLAPFVLLLRSYFGVLSNENRDKLNAATGREPHATFSNLLFNKLTNR